MPFTDKQRRSLGAKLHYKRVKTRSVPGGSVSYIEGWHAISEANRIFGFDSWDRVTLSPRCVWSETQPSHSVAFYTTKVRITVRAEGEVIVREGIGTGFGRSPHPDAAHDIALKAAETDATKRALSTFGNPFGLALYDKDQGGVSRPKPAQPSVPVSTLYILSRGDDGETKFETPTDFAQAIFAAIRTTQPIDALYAFWERNKGTLAQLKQSVPGGAALVETIIGAFKARARALRRTSVGVTEGGDGKQTPRPRAAIGLPKERRVRNKDHLTMVRRQPCLVCGRAPSHAHHVRHAQRQALGMKVSDEFTVPLCSVHHDAVHRTGDERRWWARQAIDPLAMAARLWASSLAGGLPQQELPMLGASDDVPAAEKTAPVESDAVESPTNHHT